MIEQKAKQNLIKTLVSITVASLVIIIPLSIWLSHDEELIYPPDIDLYAPQPEGGEQSYALLVKASDIELEISEDLQSIDFQDKNYYETILANADEINQLYEKIQPNLSIFAELAQFQAIGRSSSLDDLDTMIKWGGLHNIIQIINYKISLDFLMGDPVNWQPSFNIYKTMQLWAPYTAWLIDLVIYNSANKALLDSYEHHYASMQIEERETLANLLALGHTKTTAIDALERAFRCEYIFRVNLEQKMIQSDESNWIRKTFSNLIYNPNRTFNEQATYHDIYVSNLRKTTPDKAVERAQAYLDDNTNFYLKNSVGKIVTRITMPKLNLGETIYELLEQQQQLVGKLAAENPAAK